MSYDVYHIFHEVLIISVFTFFYFFLKEDYLKVILFSGFTYVLIRISHM